MASRVKGSYQVVRICFRQAIVNIDKIWSDIVEIRLLIIRGRARLVPVFFINHFVIQFEIIFSLK